MQAGVEVLFKEKKVILMKNSSIQTGVIWKDTPISQLKPDKFLNKCQSIAASTAK